MAAIQYIDRYSGKLLTEEVPSVGVMNFIYGNNPLGKLSLNLLFKRKFLSRWGGMYMDSKSSKSRISPFIKQFNVNMDEFEIPLDGFNHFNDFFYRKIKPGARPINEGIVSPADGRLLAFQNINDTLKFYVKGTEFDLSTFLKDDDLASKYAGGSMLVIRLAPVDYHRFHFCATGIASRTVDIKGAYYSVSPIALKKNLAIFLENKRAYCSIKTEHYGDIMHVDVGATMTGSIIQTYTPDTVINKGDEKGFFAFGGSTIVLLFEKDKISFSEDLLANTAKGYETYVKMGDTIGT